MSNLNKKINDNQWNKFAEPIDSHIKQMDPTSETNHNLETSAMKETAPKSWTRKVSPKSAEKLGFNNYLRRIYDLPEKNIFSEKDEDWLDLDTKIEVLDEYDVGDNSSDYHFENFLKGLGIKPKEISSNEYRNIVRHGLYPRSVLEQNFGEMTPEEYQKRIDEEINDYISENRLNWDESDWYNYYNERERD